MFLRCDSGKGTELSGLVSRRDFDVVKQDVKMNSEDGLMLIHANHSESRAVDSPPPQPGTSGNPVTSGQAGTY